MFKRKKIAILFFFLSTISYSQDVIIHGEVKNIENNNPVSYVNIGIFEKMVGTVSDENGVFYLKLNDDVKPSDTISFSIIGFETKHIPLSRLNNNNNVILIETKIEQLDEVVVFTTKSKAEVIGRNKEGNISSKFFSPYDKTIDDKLSREQGMLIKIKHTFKVQDFNFHVSINEFKVVKFRLNFYTVENGLPKELLNERDILIKVKEGYLGWVNFDLKPYNIIFDESLEEIAVTLQWISSTKKAENSERFGITAINSLKKDGLFRPKGMGKWFKWGQKLSFYLNTKYED